MWIGGQPAVKRRMIGLREQSEIARSREEIAGRNGRPWARERSHVVPAVVDGDGPVSVRGRFAVNLEPVVGQRDNPPSISSIRSSGPKTPAWTARSYAARLQR